MHKKILNQTDMDNFVLMCRLLGESSSSLKTVRDVGAFGLGPYLMGNIIRGHGGSVEEVVLGRGFGMEFIGGDNNPFPLNK